MINSILRSLITQSMALCSHYIRDDYPDNSLYIRDVLKWKFLQKNSYQIWFAIWWCFLNWSALWAKWINILFKNWNLFSNFYKLKFILLKSIERGARKTHECMVTNIASSYIKLKTYWILISLWLSFSRSDIYWC